MSNPQSTAKIGGHPLHPMIVPFPIAFFTTALVCDLAYWANGNAAWPTASIWLIGAGVVMALVAAIGGFTDFLGDGRIRNLSAAWWHLVGNLVLVAIEAFNWIIRFEGGDSVVLPWGVVLSFVAVCLMLFTAWKGGEMVYRHRVAIADSPQAASVSGSSSFTDRPDRAA